MFNLIGRFFRVLLQICTLGIVKLERGTAVQRREAIIDEKVRQVADARKSLGVLNGQGRTQARRVAQAEEKVRTLTSRKTHFMGILRNSPEGSIEAQQAEERARTYHLQLKEATEDLNRERTELQGIHREYEAAKQLVKGAEQSVTEAKRQGERLVRRRETAQRRNELLETTSALRGLDTVGNELAELDRALADDIDGLEGAAYVTAEHMAEQVAEQQLDISIANNQAEDEFEAELQKMRSTPADGSTNTRSLPEANQS